MGIDEGEGGASSDEPSAQLKKRKFWVRALAASVAWLLTFAGGYVLNGVLDARSAAEDPAAESNFARAEVSKLLPQGYQINRAIQVDFFGFGSKVWAIEGDSGWGGRLSGGLVPPGGRRVEDYRALDFDSISSWIYVVRPKRTFWDRAFKRSGSLEVLFRTQARAPDVDGGLPLFLSDLRAVDLNGSGQSQVLATWSHYGASGVWQYPVVLGGRDGRVVVSPLVPTCFAGDITCDQFLSLDEFGGDEVRGEVQAIEAVVAKAWLVRVAPGINAVVAALPVWNTCSDESVYGYCVSHAEPKPYWVGQLSFSDGAVVAESGPGEFYSKAVTSDPSEALREYMERYQFTTVIGELA